MSLALKFTSLAIRTLSKPIANFLKRQAQEHEGFRRTCIGFAQGLHRVDMRWRLGLLQDAAAIERQAQKDAARDLAKRHKHEAPTVKTEAQTRTDEEAAAKAAAKAAKEPAESSKPRKEPRIRPLSEAKAIESGANFISETFLFGVAASLLLFESWRSRRAASARRDDIQDRLNDLEDSENAARKALVELEREVLQLRAKHNIPNDKRILPKEVYEPKEDEVDMNKGWLTRIASFIGRNTKDQEAAQAALDANRPGPAESILAQSDREIEVKKKQREAEQPDR